MDIPYKKLSSGIEVPLLGLGTWKLKEKACIEALKNAWEIGYRHFDTADIYQNHREVALGLKGKPRKEYFLVSKLWHEHHHPDKVEPNLDRALKELQTDYLDMYLVHWPKRKENLPDVIYRMQEMQEKGKIRSFGVCNATIHHIQDVLNQGLKVPVNQVEIHPFFTQKPLVKFCKMEDIALTAYSPLARGEAVKDPTLQKLAEKHSKTPSQIVLSWLMKNDMIVIPKATSYEHLKENFGSLSLPLTEKELIDIDLLNKDERLVHPEFAEFDY